LSRVDPNIPASQESSRAKRQATVIRDSSSNGAASNARPNARNAINAAAPKFISIPRPSWDIRAEAWDNEADEDDESDSRDEEDTEAASETPQNQDKSATDLDSPDWPWVISSLALDKYYELEKQAENRDQDLQDVYMYNDFTAYGVNEVVDNRVRLWPTI
jgi:hypothetical protein